MNTHIVDYNTGYPAPGIGKFYTPEFVSANLRDLKERPFESGTIDVPYYLGGYSRASDPVVKGDRVQRRRKPIPRDIEKVCKRKKCGKTFMANKKETLCSDECRMLWGKEYRQAWKSARRQKKAQEAPSRTYAQAIEREYDALRSS